MSCAWAQTLLFLDRKLSQTQCRPVCGGRSPALRPSAPVFRNSGFSAWSREPGAGGPVHVPFGAEQVLSVL